CADARQSNRHDVRAAFFSILGSTPRARCENARQGRDAFVTSRTVDALGPGNAVSGVLPPRCGGKATSAGGIGTSGPFACLVVFEERDRAGNHRAARGGASR